MSSMIDDALREKRRENAVLAAWLPDNVSNRAVFGTTRDARPLPAVPPRTLVERIKDAYRGLVRGWQGAIP